MVKFCLGISKKVGGAMGEEFSLSMGGGTEKRGAGPHFKTGL